MSTISKFVEALKEYLQSSSKNFVTTGDPFANGSTETGFYPDYIVDMDELTKDIDEFAKTFQKGNK